MRESRIRFLSTDRISVAGTVRLNPSDKALELPTNLKVNAAIPYKTGDRLNPRLLLTGPGMKEKGDDYFDIPSVRNGWLRFFPPNNTFQEGRNLFFTPNAVCQPPAIQGIDDPPHSLTRNAGAKRIFTKDKVAVSIRCNHPSDTSALKYPYMTKIRISIGIRTFTPGLSRIRFSYRFRGYTRRTEETNTSCFGHSCFLLSCRHYFVLIKKTASGSLAVFIIFRFFTEKQK